MARSKSFILYIDSMNLVELLTDEQSGKLFKSIFRYVEFGEMPELDDVSRVVFTAIKNYLDRDRDKYEAVCIKRAECGKKGGLAKATKNYQMVANGSNIQQDISNLADSVNNNEIVNNNDNKRNTILSHPTKHKYGEYQNVKLSDEEYSKLKEEFPSDWSERITKLDEYIESSGKSYKNHLATIRNWSKREYVKKEVSEDDREHTEQSKYYREIF